MKILFACSASGGHIFPALGVARAIKDKDSSVRIAILTEKNQVSESILSNSEFEIMFLKNKISPKINFPLLNSFLKLMASSVKIFSLLRGLKPDIIVGFGGYVSIVPVLFSRFFGARCVIHEQNACMGKANRFLAGFAQLIAVSFKATKDAFRGKKFDKKIIYTGLPLRKDLKRLDRSRAAAFFKFDPKYSTILVLGGSTGSAAINRYFLDAVDKLEKKENLQIIHISGARDEAEARSFYDRHPYLRARVFSFFEEMSYAFSLADICISRSGASTVYELGFFRLPSILIPYPYASGHQFENARVLSDSNAAVLLQEREALNKLPQVLGYFLDNANRLEEISNNFPSDLIFDASERLGNLITANDENN